MGPAYRTNKTVRMVHAICKVLYLSCGTNFWFEDLRYPPMFMKIYNRICKVIEVIMVLFVILGWGPFYTQHNLTVKQNNDMYLFAFGNVVIYLVYVHAIYYKREIREQILTLVVKLKEVCNDEIVERMLIRTTARYLTALVFVCCSGFLSYGLGSGFQSITSNATFTTVIPIWPDVEDRRLIAAVTRILFFIIWCIFMVRVISIYVVVLTSTICVAHQYKNLCNYFEGLNSIFEDAGTQRNQEKKYEEAFNVGIKMHNLTLWCTRQMQLTGSVTFSAQVIINVSVLVIFMLQMMLAERTLTAVVPIVVMILSCLVSSGVFMCNAGDVTVEASLLPTAMFHSGWHNCQSESSVRVRKMVTIAMTQAQDQVVIKGLGIIELSYDSYVTIVKSAYSLFSVLY